MMPLPPITLMLPSLLNTLLLITLVPELRLTCSPTPSSSANLERSAKFVRVQHLVMAFIHWASLRYKHRS